MTLKYLPIMSIALLGALSACQKVTVDEAASKTAVSAQAAADLPKEADIKEAPMSDLEMESVEKLKWVKSADAAADAKAALMNKTDGKVRVWAYSGRGPVYPGLSAEQLAVLDGKIETAYLEGMGDVIHGATQKALRKDVRDYAKSYNMAVFEALTN